MVDEDGNPWHNDAKRFKELNEGVSGVHCCLPFQCEVCWIRNLEGRNPTRDDEAYIQSLRRANLDAMVGKSKDTIAGHKRRTGRMVTNSERINKTPGLQSRGPFEIGDFVGMSLAVDILQESIHAVGRNEPTVQAETLRQLRATYTKNWDSSPRGVLEVASFGRGAGRVRPTSCPSQSEWFADFWRGLEARMGHKSKANHAITITAMVHAIKYIKDDAADSPSIDEANYLLKVGAFLTICTAASLRGYEGFYTELAGLRRFIHVGREGVVPHPLNKATVLTEEQCMALPHVVLPLLGKFKGEVGIDHHVINLANETMSGLQPRWWLEKLVEIADFEGRVGGPAFASPTGDLLRSADVDATFRAYLHRVQQTKGSIPKSDDVDTMFGISRTPRRSATSRAKRAGYEKLAEEMNRWRKVELAQNKRARHKMSALYSEAILMMPTTWRVSHAL